jgi:hypothetical protein
MGKKRGAFYMPDDVWLSINVGDKSVPRYESHQRDPFPLQI